MADIFMMFSNWLLFLNVLFILANCSYVSTSEPLNIDSVYEFPKVHLVVFPSCSITVSWEC